MASSDWGATLFDEWGRSLATLHTLARRYSPPGYRRLRWDEDDVLVNAQAYLPATESSARRELSRVQDWLIAQPAGGNEFGLIHGDFCRVNFHYDRPHITVFDFDDSCYHWFVYDLVCALAPAYFRPQDPLSFGRSLKEASLGHLQRDRPPASCAQTVLRRKSGLSR